MYIVQKIINNNHIKGDLIYEICTSRVYMFDGFKYIQISNSTIIGLIKEFISSFDKKIIFIKNNKEENYIDLEELLKFIDNL